MRETRNLCTIRVGGNSGCDLQAGCRPGPQPVLPPAPQLGPGADRGPASQPEELRLGGARGLAPRGGQAEKRRRAPKGSTLPSFTPSPRQSPEGNRRGAVRRDKGGGGGASSVRKAPPPEWRPRVINKLRFCPGVSTAAGRRICKACGGG